MLHVLKVKPGRDVCRHAADHGRVRRLAIQPHRFRHPGRSPRAAVREEQVLVIDAEHFEPEGDDCDAVLIVKAYKLGWRRFIVYKYRGQRFTGCGFGPATEGVRIDVYGSSGDYLASGIDGMEIHVHGNAQDQLGQIMKDGKLVVYGDVGQTFMYGAKGGEVYVMGNAAGRPLINAVGKPRVVINGTALDYLAESFMAGDPLNGGGFVILNGIGFDDRDGIDPGIRFALSRVEHLFPGLRRRHLRARPAPEAGGRAAQRRRVRRAHGCRLEADSALSGGERKAVRHFHRAAADRGRQKTGPPTRSTARSGRRRRCWRRTTAAWRTGRARAGRNSACWRPGGGESSGPGSRDRRRPPKAVERKRTTCRRSGGHRHSC